MTLNVLIGNGSWYPVIPDILVTAPVINVQRSGTDFVTYQVLSVATWQNQMPTMLSPGYPIQRQFQWQVNGVDVPNMVGTMFSAGRADAGKSITVKEIAYFLSNPSVQFSAVSNSLTASFTPSLTTLYYDDIEYLGSFNAPSAASINYGGYALSFDPAGNGGAGSLFLMNSSFYGYEISIPTPSKTSFPTASLLASASNTFSGINFKALGLSPDNASATMTMLPLSGGKMLLSRFMQYPSDLDGQNGIGLFYIRNSKNLSSASTFDGPYSVTDPTGPAPSNYQRSMTGYASEIPEAHQTALGGTHIIGCTPDSTGFTGSSGPSINVIDIADFTNTKQLTFVIQGGSSNTIQLPTSASSVNDFYKGCFIQLVAENGTTDNNSAFNLVDSYDGATRTATMAANFTQPVVVGKYAWVITKVSAKALANYATTPYGTNETGFTQNNNIYDTSGLVANAIIPNGLNDTLCFGAKGEGYFVYMSNDVPWMTTQYPVTVTSVTPVGSEWDVTFSSPPSVTLTAGYPAWTGVQGEQRFSISQLFSQTNVRLASITTQLQGVTYPAPSAPVNGDMFFTRNYRYPLYIYDPRGQSTGEHAWPYYFKLWTYSVSDLVAVKNGSISPNATPTKQVFSLNIPQILTASPIPYPYGAAYDKTNRILYVSVVKSAPGIPLINAFRINSATPA